MTFVVLGLRFTTPYRFATVLEKDLKDLKTVGENHVYIEEDLWRKLETFEAKTQDAADAYVEKEYAKYCFSCQEKICWCCSE